MILEKLKTSEKLAYGLGNAGGTIAFGAISSFIAYYYTDVAGISAAVVGTLLFVSRLLDGLSDLGMGILIDKTKSKHGKARPWILWMAIPSGIATALIFSVPDIGETGKIIYAYITYTIAISVIYTAITSPYQAMISLMTQDQNQRSILNIISSFMASVVTIVIGAMTLPIVQMLGDGSEGWQRTFIIFGTLSTIFFLICYFFTIERVKPVASEKAKSIPVKDGFLALLKNKYWLLLVLMIIFTFLNQGAIMGTNVYYAKYFLNDENLVGLLTIATFAPVMVLMLFLASIVKRFGKRNTAIIGSVVMIMGQLLLMIAPQDITIVVIASVLKGLGMGPLLGTLFAMLADTVEYGEWKSGLRIEGLVFSAAGMGTKIGMGLGTALVGWILAMGGYSSGSALQTDGALLAIQILFIYLPILLSIVQIVILAFYKLDKEFILIVEELESRNQL